MSRLEPAVFGHDLKAVHDRMRRPTQSSACAIIPIPYLARILGSQRSAAVSNGSRRLRQQPTALVCAWGSLLGDPASVSVTKLRSVWSLVIGIHNSPPERATKERDMRITVVGGTGLIGTKLVGQLRAKGHEVVVAARAT